ncbi:MAG TPA: hypothetical protein PLO52_11645 [Flavobacterium alvei]|nr:hypothetical protein [Flavobacterium alvei]HQK40753.1 hypothetical protein [Flavobacterium alvei]
MASFSSGCVAIQEEYMKIMVSWLDPKQNPTIIMGNLDVLKAGFKKKDLTSYKNC